MSYLCYPRGNSASKDDIEGQGQVLKNGGGDSVKETKTLKTYILDPSEKFLKRWSLGFVLSCVTAVALDPLFFYLPVINQSKKCIGFDSRLWKTTLVLRSFFDIIHLLNIILQFRTGFVDEELRKLGKPELNTDAWKIAQKYLWPWFLFDILSIIPIPQVVVPIIISEMRGTESTNKVKFLNAIVLFQYVPRVYQIYLSWRKLITNDKKFDRIILVKASLNFILYILAGHVLGAFWYFFSTQRLAACWHVACDQNRTRCYGTSFNCSDRSSGDLSFINDICPINVPNTTSTFDFGIFLLALQSGVLESPDFPQKLFFSFWWGMRNLSSLGGNLETSNYIWENCFALSISVFGLILFLYFLGNLQLKIIKDNGLAMRTQLLLKICDSLQPKFYNEHCYIVKEGDPVDAVFLITEGIVWTCTSNNSEGTNSQHAERLVKEDESMDDDYDDYFQDEDDYDTNAQLYVSPRLQTNIGV